MPQKITLTLRPEAAFEMPYSEGYQLYSALLGVMKEARLLLWPNTRTTRPSAPSPWVPWRAASCAASGHHAQGRRCRGEVRSGGGDNRSKGGRDLPLHHCTVGFERAKSTPGKRRAEGGGAGQLYSEL